LTISGTLPQNGLKNFSRHKIIFEKANGLNVSLPAPLNAFLYLTGVGSKNFVQVIKEKLGIRAKGRKVGESKGAYHLREAQAAYHIDFTPEKDGLKSKTTVFGTLILQFSFSACYSNFNFGKIFKSLILKRSHNLYLPIRVRLLPGPTILFNYVLPFIFFMILGMKNEKIKSPIEKKTLKDISSPQFPEAQISFNVPIKKVKINVPTIIPRPVPAT